MQVFYCDHFELPLPPGHRFPIAKYQRTRERVSRLLMGQIHLAVAPAATYEQLLLIHDKDYLDKTFRGTLSELEQRRIGFPWSRRMLERSRRSTGATVAAAKVALEQGVAVHLSGGTHHAFAAAGQGFCVFNDVAVAAAVLFEKQQINRGLVIDLDVHQGNGTASIFQGDPRVFTFSMHGDRNFPFRKTEGDLDIALPDGTDDEAYLETLQQTLDHQLPDDFDFIFYLAGADPYAEDRMGRLKLSKSGLQRRDEMVLSFCDHVQCPVAVVMAGGYGPIDDVVDIHVATVQSAYRHWLNLNQSPVI